MFRPLTPYEVERQERERVARRKPHLAMPTSRQKPDIDTLLAQRQLEQQP